MIEELEKKSVEAWLKSVIYSDGDEGYIPSDFALEFITFIKLVNKHDGGEEHLTPVMHYRMLDNVPGNGADILNMCFRGAAKTSVLGEYLFLFLAAYGSIPGFGEITVAIYVSDTIENGVSNMRKNLEYRWLNSPFLQKYIPRARFTEIRWLFHNIDGKPFVVTGYGAKTGVRGKKEFGKRPSLCVLDDIVSDQDARSPTVIASIEDTVYKAVDYALHSQKRKIIWSGTPFNTKDPLYKAVGSGAWKVNVFPVCERFPCTREEFRGAWGDRFDFDYVNKQYQKAKKLGKIADFNQELMLKIISDEDRLVLDEDIVYYKVQKVLKNKGNFNFYFTTDFATGEDESNDFSVICVWAYTNNGEWLLVDGVCKKQLMDENIKHLFRLVQKYKPQGVGVEVSGQQGGFIPWIQEQMLDKNTYFHLVSEGNKSKPGIRPSTNKMARFNVVLPQFKLKKIWVPEDSESNGNLEELLVELNDELKYASPAGFKSLHDDVIDNISMLPLMNAWKPSVVTVSEETGMWDDDLAEKTSSLESYIA